MYSHRLDFVSGEQLNTTLMMSLLDSMQNTMSAFQVVRKKAMIARLAPKKQALSKMEMTDLQSAREFVDSYKDDGPVQRFLRAVAAVPGGATTVAYPLMVRSGNSLPDSVSFCSADCRDVAPGIAGQARGRWACKEYQDEYGRRSQIFLRDGGELLARCPGRRSGRWHSRDVD